jgi:hypothetical protein
MGQGQLNQALFWVVLRSRICATGIRPVPLPSDSAATLVKALPFPGRCGCPYADGTLQTQVMLVQHRISAVGRPGPGGELERMPGKARGALVEQGRCKPVAWERPSIVPLLLLYYSSIVPLVLAVYFPATQVPASTGVQCRHRDSGWAC